jgi:hypothetical protein
MRVWKNKNKKISESFIRTSYRIRSIGLASSCTVPAHLRPHRTVNRSLVGSWNVKVGRCTKARSNIINSNATTVGVFGPIALNRKHSRQTVNVRNGFERKHHLLVGTPIYSVRAHGRAIKCLTHVKNTFETIQKLF